MTIVELVERERGRLRRLHIALGIAVAASATAALLAIGASTLGGARWMSLPRPMPFLVWLLVIGADVAIVLWTVRRLNRRTARNTVAAVIEREQAMRAGSVRGAMEVANTGALGRRAAAAVGERLAPAATRLAPVERRATARGALQALGAAVLALGALAFTAPKYNDGFLAIMKPVSAWQGSLLPRLAFTNLPPEVLRGESVRLKIAAEHRGTVSVSQRMPGEAWATQRVAVDPKTGVASVEVGPLRGDLRIVATDGRSISDTATVRVTDRPFVGAVSMRATYPSYLGRSPEALPVGEPARVPQGTIIDISGRASTSLSDVRLSTTTDTFSLHVSDHAFEGRLATRKSGHYAWIANGTSGPIADVPPPLELEVVPDSVPRVELVSPATDTIVAGDDKVLLHATASDDHGLSRVDMISWRQGPIGQPQAPGSQHLADVGVAVWDGSAVLDLASKGLKPGDALHVKIVATDNSPWAQIGESRELLLKIPTMEERRAIARASMDSAVSQVSSAAQAEKQLEQRTNEASRDRTRSQQDAQSNGASADKKGSMSYDQAEKAKAVAKDQRELADQVKNLQQAAAQLEEKMRQAGALDSAIARQLQEAQQMLRDAMTPEMLAQMKKLEDATQNLKGDQAQQSLKDLQAMQQKLREQLEKSAEMLKRAAMEGAMETLKDEAKEIADKDRTLADSAKAKSAEQQKAEAKQLADRSQRFNDELKKLQDRLAKENANAGEKGTEEARKHAKDAEEAMRQAAGNQKQNQNQQNQNTKPDSASAKRDSTSRTAQQNGQQQQSGQQQNQGAKGQNNDKAAGDKSGQQKEGGQQQSGQSGDTEQNARDAASKMDQASDAMKQARESQVGEWKSELTQALDQAIQEMLQMARQEQQLEQKARSGQSKPEELRGEQSAVKQGLDNAAQKLQQEGQKTSLLSGRSQRSVSEAQQKVSEAMQQTGDARNSQQAATSLGDAADALNRAAASLARDREKANTSNSATGFAEMIQQMQEMAKKQGNINAQAQGLMPGMGQPMSSQMQATSRVLAKEQRQVAQQLDELSEAAGGDRAAQLAKEAKALAEALEGGRLDASTVARQQQLFRRMLDAGRTLEKDEREDTQKREAKSAKQGNDLKPDNTNATGKAALKFREPTWEELRGLSADQRRAILEYFKRINAGNPNP